MIRTVMLGRTGNNLFQYAAGRALAERHGTSLIMDGSWFNRRNWEQVKMIETLPIKARLTRHCPLASKALRRMTGRHHLEYVNSQIYREPTEDTSFDPAALKLPANSLLFGYFQTPLYFTQIENQIRSELSFEGRKLDAESQRIAGKLLEAPSIAVHIRRTDYIGNPNTEVCNALYYRNAFTRIREIAPDAAFYIFSDDPDWCRENYLANDFTIVDCQASRSDPLNDLHLMTLASHHIIANSSYSWWAAWLGGGSDQQVLMPPEWFRGIRSPITEKQCEGWEIITC
jgi:hypothetical protein